MASQRLTAKFSFCCQNAEIFSHPRSFFRSCEPVNGSSLKFCQNCLRVVFYLIQIFTFLGVSSPTTNLIKRSNILREMQKEKKDQEIFIPRAKPFVQHLMVPTVCRSFVIVLACYYPVLDRFD